MPWSVVLTVRSTTMAATERAWSSSMTQGEHLVGHVVEQVGVGRGRRRLLIPGREGLGHVLGLVPEVEHEGVSLLGVDPVEAVEGPDGSEPHQDLATNMVWSSGWS